MPTENKQQGPVRTITAEEMAKKTGAPRTITLEQMNERMGGGSVSPDTPPRQIKQNSFLQRSSNIMDTVFGGAGLGNALGSSFATIGLMARGDFEAAKEVEPPSFNEVLGDLIKMGTTIGSAALPVGKAVSTAGKLATGAGIGAAQGAALGTAEAIKEEKAPGEAMKAAIKAGTTGGIVGGTFSGLIRTVGPLSKKLMEGSVNLSKSVEKLGIKRGTDATKILRDKKIFGSARSMFNKTQSGIKQTNKQIDSIAGSLKGKVQTKQIAQQAIKDTIEEFDGNITDSIVSKIMANPRLPFKKLITKGELTVKEANKLRQIIDNKFIGNRKWLSDSPDPLQLTVLKTTAHTLRNYVKSQDSRLPQLYDDVAGYYTAEDILANTLASKRGMGSILAENGILIGGAAGGIAGGGFAFPLAAGAIVAGTRMLGSTTFKSTTSVLSGALGVALQKLPEQFTREQLINAVLETQEE